MAKDTRRTPRVGIVALDGLHQADVALLDQVGMRQAVAQVAAGNRDDQTKMRRHQLARGIQILLIAETAGKRLLLRLAQHRHTIRGRDERLDATAGGKHREMVKRHGLTHGGTSLKTILALLT
jgi:hypothetical protein